MNETSLSSKIEIVNESFVLQSKSGEEKRRLFELSRERELLNEEISG